MSVMQERRRDNRMLLGQDGNALVNLLAVNVILFLILKFLFLVYKVSEFNMDLYYKNIFHWFTLPIDLTKLATRPWTIITSLFVHENVFHLIANMLWMWLFGFILQDMMGNRKLAPVYLYGGVAGILFYVLSYYIFPSLQPALPAAVFFGANASIMAIAVATTTVTPGYRIFPMINGGIPLWIITVIYVIIDFTSIAPGDPAKYLAHTAGGVTGFLFIHQIRRGNDWSLWMNNLFDWIGNLFTPTTKAKKRSAKDEFFYKVKGSKPFQKTPHVTQQRIDTILDKINQQGYHQLTREEKDILKRASEEGEI